VQAYLSKKLSNLNGLVVARSDDEIMLPRWGVHLPGMLFCPLVQWRISSGAQAILLRCCQLRSIHRSWMRGAHSIGAHGLTPPAFEHVITGHVGPHCRGDAHTYTHGRSSVHAVRCHGHAYQTNSARPHSSLEAGHKASAWMGKCL